MFLLDLRDGYYARSGLLDHLNGDGFDYWSDQLPHFPRGLLHWCAVWGFALATVGFAAFVTLRALHGWLLSFWQFSSLLNFCSLLTFGHDPPPLWLVVRNA